MVQRLVNPRQTAQGQVANKRSLELVVANVPVHPAQKHGELRADRQHRE